MGLFTRENVVRERAAWLADRGRCTLTDAFRDAFKE